MPAYSVVLQASTLVSKRISPIEEFLMRCLKAGITNCNEIAAFLGLEQPLVESVTSTLIAQNDVCLAGVAGSTQQVLALTMRGQHSLQEAESIVPEERTF